MMGPPTANRAAARRAKAVAAKRRAHVDSSATHVRVRILSASSPSRSSRLMSRGQTTFGGTTGSVLRVRETQRPRRPVTFPDCSRNLIDHYGEAAEMAGLVEPDEEPFRIHSKQRVTLWTRHVDQVAPVTSEVHRVQRRPERVLDL